jgi:protein involved in plasmid replication-relaxation
VRWRVVARLERRQGGLRSGSDAWTYALEVAGQRLLRDRNGARRRHLPGPPMWAHALATAEAYARLAETLRGTDRRLGAVWQGEPECWRDYRGALGERLRLKPDAFVRVDGPHYSDLAFVETDTGSQSRTVIRSKLAAYKRYAATGQEQLATDGVFPQVVFLATALARRELIRELVDDQPTDARQLFVVGLTSEAGQLLTGSEEAA